MKSQDDNDESEVQGFSLQSGTDSFVSRSKDIFAGLGTLEDKHSAFLKATALSREREQAELMKDDPADEENSLVPSKNRPIRPRLYERSRLSETWKSDYKPRTHSQSRDREDKYNEQLGRDDEFKHPHSPPAKRARPAVPDFKRHPEKYTCYTLSDVSSRDMSEKANQQAAYAFLEERRLEREEEERRLVGLPEEEPKFDASVAACSQGKLAFSHPKSKKARSESCVTEKKEQADATIFEKSTRRHYPENLSTENDDYVDVSDVVKIADLDRPVDQGAEEQHTFKSRKNVKRHIRHKDNDGEDSD